MTVRKLRPIRRRKQDESMREKGYLRVGRRWMKAETALFERARRSAQARRRG